VALLADTHALLWFWAGDRRLSRIARAALANPDEEIFVSVVSHWEIEVKRRRHAEFDLPRPLIELMEEADFLPLAMEFATPARLANLPDIHADRFDRMLIAQALHHELTLVSGDRLVRRYPVPILW